MLVNEWVQSAEECIATLKMAQKLCHACAAIYQLQEQGLLDVNDAVSPSSTETIHMLGGKLAVTSSTTFFSYLRLDPHDSRQWSTTGELCGES